MNFDQFLRLLPKINNLPLPGRTAQFEMAPMERVKELSAVDIEKFNPKQAAVMALFYPDHLGTTHFVLMLRKTYKGVHSNQVGFPGGKTEDSDKDLKHTALRETEEEIGIVQNSIEVVRSMTNIYIPPSNFWVQSYMGYIDYVPNFIPQASEVESLIEVPLLEFMHPDAVIEKKLSTSYATNMKVPAYELQGHVVWGATAMMLSEMKVLLHQIMND